MIKNKYTKQKTFQRKTDNTSSRMNKEMSFLKFYFKPTSQNPSIACNLRPKTQKKKILKKH